MGTVADFGIHQRAGTTQEEAARQETSANSPIGLAESILQEQTNPQQDSLWDYRGLANRNHQHVRGATLASTTVEERPTELSRGATLALTEQKEILTDVLQGATLAGRSSSLIGIWKWPATVAKGTDQCMENSQQKSRKGIELIDQAIFPLNQRIMTTCSTSCPEKGQPEGKLGIWLAKDGMAFKEDSGIWTPSSSQ